ncbi:putative Sodium/calcium exchanger family protein / calcium-binding EF hand family protein [Melia azedarach]|uniref:Sodium/calcium exchanger family protein / calcium-binding EF hand family protein n=1 Tax=Melia azedarach TaxID=155640 RepID=A0ACC1YRG0_MELAZ|nr:putative Sodium/calcium exchanger family protein / calcium-binding EF hand family protein [Melia azedarach]
MQTVLASELLYRKEVAEEHVQTGVGLLAGSSILHLTVIWGTCVIVGNRVLPGVSQTSINPSDGSFSRELSWDRLLSSLTSFGIRTDLETSYIARIMVFSVTPFLIMQLLKILPESGNDAVMLIALTVSVVFLLLYFCYQIFQPWIQQRRLEYVKHEHLILRILKHVQNHALGRILADDGSPNVDAIRRLFEEIDQDGDDMISPSELRELLLEVKFDRMHIDKEKAIAEVIKEFDIDSDQKITKDEFVNGLAKWLDEAKNAIDKRYYSRKSLREIYRVFQPWLQNKRKEREMRKNIIAGILEHVRINALGKLLTEDGTPNTSAIRRLFEETDRDGNNFISKDELKELLMDIKFGKVPSNADEVVAKVIEELDTSGDRMIDQEEFVAGISKWLNTTPVNESPSTTETQDDIYQKTWEETDKLVDDEESIIGADNSVWAWIKAIMHLVLGVVILSVLAEPLIYSVENFSKAANLPSFFISFILVPLATNFRAATSAISAACRKKPRTTSLAFSEIYGGVFMNNILGFSVLLSLIYLRGLKWEFSAEILVVVVVCGVIGILASFRSTFPVWISFLAYLLYPLSLLLVYLLNDVLNYV